MNVKKYYVLLSSGCIIVEWFAYTVINHILTFVFTDKNVFGV